ncbi:MAG: RidA family protein [Pseudomonadota bacterium]
MTGIQHFGPAATLPSGVRNPLTHAVRAGDFVFVSGLMPKSTDGQIVTGSIVEQTDNVMHRLIDMLGEADCALDDVVKVTAWLTDREDFVAFNEAYAKFFSGSAPARSAVRCDLLLPGARLELEAIAYKPVAS